MLVLAHRGYHAELPENTLAAFDAAVNVGADGIETDIRVTHDGVPVLFHDPTIQGQAVAGLTHVELCRLSQREVPTLVSALDAWPDIFWNLEIKLPTDPAAVWPVLREYRERRRLLVSSFWHPVAVQAGRELGVDCGLLVAHRPLSFTSLAHRLARRFTDGPPIRGLGMQRGERGVDQSSPCRRSEKLRVRSSNLDGSRYAGGLGCRRNNHGPSGPGSPASRLRLLTQGPMHSEAMRDCPDQCISSGGRSPEGGSFLTRQL